MFKRVLYICSKPGRGTTTLINSILKTINEENIIIFSHTKKQDIKEIYSEKYKNNIYEKFDESIITNKNNLIVFDDFYLSNKDYKKVCKMVKESLFNITQNKFIFNVRTITYNDELINSDQISYIYTGNNKTTFFKYDLSKHNMINGYCKLLNRYEFIWITNNEIIIIDNKLNIIKREKTTIFYNNYYIIKDAVDTISNYYIKYRKCKNK